MVGQAVASGIISAATNVGSALAHGEEIDLVDVVDAGIGAASSLVGSAVTNKAASSAKSTIAKGIKRVISGKNRYDNGSRYFKGAMKQGMRLIGAGVRRLNTAQGVASVIGSVVGGTASVTKGAIKDKLL